MQCVATLITDPVRADLSSHHVEAVTGALAAAGAEITATDWLDEGTACDLVFTGPAPAAARQAVSDAVAAPGFDIAVQPCQGRRKDLLVIDMDSTVVSGETLDELAVGRHGPEVIVVRARARSFLHHQVRNMVGTLALVGEGKWSAADVARALAARDRKAGGPTAPAEGLYLVSVGYQT